MHRHDVQQHELTTLAHDRLRDRDPAFHDGVDSTVPAGPGRRLAGGIAVVAFFVAAAVALTYPFVFHLGDAVRDPGDPLLNTWILAWDAHALATDPLHLFQANIFYPFPGSLTFSETLIGGAIFAAPLIWLTGNPVLAHNVLSFASFVLCGLGAYTLTYHLTRHRGGALLAGILFAYCPYRFDQFSHLQLLLIQWLPFALLFLHRGFASGRMRDFAGFGLFFTLQALSSFYYAFFTAIAVGTFLTFELLTRPASRRPAILVRLGAALLTSGLFVLPFGLPYFESQKLFGFERGLDEVIDLSASFQDYLAAPPGNAIYGALTRPFTSPTKWPAEHFIFPGLIGPILLLVGLIAWRRPVAPKGQLLDEERTLENIRRPLVEIEVSATREQIRYLLLFGLAFVLSLGPFLRVLGHLTRVPLPYLFLYRVVPGFTALRAPVRFDVIVMLSLAVLAGYGLARVDAVARRYQGVLSRVLVSGAVVGSALEFSSVPVAMSPIQVGQSIPPVYHWLAEHDRAAPVVEIPVSEQADFFYEYFSTYHWHPVVNGQSGFVPPGYAEIAADANAFPERRAVRSLAALGVRYVVVHGTSLGPRRRQAILDETSSSGGVRLVRRFGSDDLYELDEIRTAVLSDARIQIQVPARVGTDTPASAILVVENAETAPLVPGPLALAATIRWEGDRRETHVPVRLPIVLDAGGRWTTGIPIPETPSPGVHRLTVSVAPPLQISQTSSVTVTETIATSTARDGLAALTYDWQLPAHLRAGQEFRVQTTARNLGSAEWLARTPGYRGQVGLGIRGWYSEDGQTVVGPNGTPLGARGWMPSDVLPGQEVTISLLATAPATPGRYRLKLDLVSENVAWFSDVHPDSQTEQVVEVLP